MFIFIIHLTFTSGQESALFHLEHAPDTGMVIRSDYYKGIKGQPLYIYATDFFAMYGITPGGGGGGGSVDAIPSVSDTATLSPSQGDVFVVESITGDTVGFYSGSAWYYFAVGGPDGNGIISALPQGNVIINADTNTLAITNLNNMIITGQGLFTIQKNGASNFSLLAPDATLLQAAENVDVRYDSYFVVRDQGNPVFVVDTVGVYLDTAYVTHEADPDVVLVLKGERIHHVPITFFKDGNGIYSGSGAIPDSVNVTLNDPRYLYFSKEGAFSNTPILGLYDNTLFGSPTIMELRRSGATYFRLVNDPSGSINFTTYGTYDLNLTSAANLVLNPSSQLLAGTGVNQITLPSFRPVSGPAYWEQSADGSGQFRLPSQFVLTNPYGGANTLGAAIDSLYANSSQDGNGIISELPISDVEINAAFHSLYINSLSYWGIEGNSAYMELDTSSRQIRISVDPEGWNLGLQGIATANIDTLDSILGLTQGNGYARAVPVSQIPFQKIVYSDEIEASTENFNPDPLGSNNWTTAYINPREQIYIEGIDGNVDGRKIELINIGTGMCIMASGLSADPTKEYYPKSENFCLRPGRSVSLIYSDTLQSWVILEREQPEGSDQVYAYYAGSPVQGDQDAIVYGASGDATFGATNPSGNRPAALNLTTGTGSTNIAYAYFVRSHSGVFAAQNIYTAVEAYMYIDTVSTNTEEFVAGLELTSAPTGGAGGNGSMGIRYNNNTVGGGWEGWTKNNAGVETTVDLGSFSLVPTLLRFETDTNMEVVNFFINGVQVGSIDTNFPTSGTALSPRAFIQKIDGSTDRDAQVFNLKITTKYDL